MVMLSKKAIEKHLHPHGLIPTAYRIHPPEETAFPELHVSIDQIAVEEDWYEVHFEGFQASTRRPINCRVQFFLPRLNEKKTFMWGDRQRTIVSRCYQDLTAPVDKRRWLFDTPGHIVVRELQKAFAGAMRDFYFTGNPPSSDMLRRRIARIFSDSRWCPVLGGGALAKKSLRELVYLDLPETLDLEVLRFPSELYGILDPTSTSSGEKVNRVYRLCQGVTINRQGVAKPSKVPFCSTLADNAISLDLVPHRTNTLRTSFEAALDLVNPEEPWAAGEMHDLQGVHLETALMDFKWLTWEDCIVVSRSAATKLKAVRQTQEVVETFGPLTLKVKEGDPVMPGGQLLGVGMSREGKRVPFVARKLYHQAWVEKVTACRTYVLGRPAIRYRFFLISHIEAKTGDKVTTRGGTKGVLKVVPDAQMPKREDGTLIECCMSPFGVYSRKAVIVPWEMMLNKRQTTEHCRMTYEHLSQLRKVEPSCQTLVDEGWGKKEQLFLKGKPLEEETFAGPLFVIRIDKIAREIASVQSGDRVLNHHGVPTNKARLSGMRRDLAKAVAMDDRGLHACLAESIRENISGIKHVRRIASVLEPETYFEE